MDRCTAWLFNGTPTQNYPVITVPSKINNSNLYQKHGTHLLKQIENITISTLAKTQYGQIN